MGGPHLSCSLVISARTAIYQMRSVWPAGVREPRRGPPARSLLRRRGRGPVGGPGPKGVVKACSRRSGKHTLISTPFFRRHPSDRGIFAVVGDPRWYHRLLPMGGPYKGEKDIIRADKTTAGPIITLLCPLAYKDLERLEYSVPLTRDFFPVSLTLDRRNDSVFPTGHRRRSLDPAGGMLV